MKFLRRPLWPSWRAEWSVVQNARTGHEGAVPQHLLRDDYRVKGLAVPRDPEPTAAELARLEMELGK